MIDFANKQSLIIPEGEVVSIQFLTNLIGSSIDTDGSVYNGCGYRDGYRLSSSGAEKEYTSSYFESTVTGFIPVSNLDVLYIEDCYWFDTNNALNYICGYDSSFNFIGAETSQWVNGVHSYGTKFIDYVTGDKHRAKAVLKPMENLAYVRVSCCSHHAGQTISGADIQVSTKSSAITAWEKYLYTNWVPKSTEADGVTIYNGDLGYKGATRLNSSGTEVEGNYNTTFGYIPVKGGDTIRFKGKGFNNADVIWYNPEAYVHYICVYDAEFNFLYAGLPGGGYSTTSFVESMGLEDVTSVIKLKEVANIAYFRMCAAQAYSIRGMDGSTAIITVNEPITDSNPDVLVYTVFNSFTNCSTSNKVTVATENTAYNATITANDGYTLDGATISVKMGGVDITSTAYSNGVISINSVTGSISITVTAAVIGPSYTNLIPKSTEADGKTIYNGGLGYKNGYRIRSGGAEAGSTAAVCTGFIPFVKGDKLYIYPAFTGMNTYNAINFYNASYENLGQITDDGSSYGICKGYANQFKTTLGDGVSILDLSNNTVSGVENIAFVRITNNNATVKAENMIITKNEEIV